MGIFKSSLPGNTIMKIKTPIGFLQLGNVHIRLTTLICGSKYMFSFHSLRRQKLLS